MKTNWFIGGIKKVTFLKLYVKGASKLYAQVIFVSATKIGKNKTRSTLFIINLYFARSS